MNRTFLLLFMVASYHQYLLSGSLTDKQSNHTLYHNKHKCVLRGCLGSQGKHS